MKKRGNKIPREGTKAYAEYWLGRPAAERLEEVERLRGKHHGRKLPKMDKSFVRSIKLKDL